MMGPKKIYLIFIPAILLALIALIVRMVQYEPLFPDKTENETNTEDTLSIVPIFDEDIIIGSKRAPITLIAFEDLGCHSCNAQLALLTQLQQKYPNTIKIIWKTLSVTTFPYPSEKTNNYGYCAYDQGVFDAFKQFAFDHIDTMTDQILLDGVTTVGLNQKRLEKCLTSEALYYHIEKNKQLAHMLNIQSVPTFFFQNKQVATPETLSQWEALLQLP